jgi:hypothetical protein
MVEAVVDAEEFAGVVPCRVNLIVGFATGFGPTSWVVVIGVFAEVGSALELRRPGGNGDAATGATGLGSAASTDGTMWIRDTTAISRRAGPVLNLG